MEAGPEDREDCSGTKEEGAVLALHKESMLVEAPAFWCRFQNKYYRNSQE